MTTIDIFYQGECVQETDHVQASATQNIGELKRQLIQKHSAADDILVFCEDRDDALSDDVELAMISGAVGSKLHLHRCLRIAVSVNFSGQTVHRKFAPSSTIARIKKWTARKEFGMSKAEAGEHRLQISGTHDRPAPGTHVGCLTSHPDCAVEFDLVPDERINGAFTPAHSCGI